MRLTLLALSLLSSLNVAAAVTGFVVDEDGKPLVGVKVQAIAPELPDAVYARLVSASPEPVAIAEAQSGENGAFRIDMKRQPVVTLLVEAPGRTSATRDVVDGDAVTFQLRAAPVRTGRITANGKPVANALVIFNYHFLTRTNEAGEYRVSDPKEWGTRLHVLHPDYAMADRIRTRGAESWTSLDMTLESGIAVRGRVVDAAGRPVANAIIRNTTWPVATSAEDGTFTIAHLPPGVKTLYAREGTRTGSAAPGAETIVLRPGGTIVGSVRSSRDDTPVAGAILTVRPDPPAGLRFGSAITDAKGNFLIEGLPAGVLRLSLSHPAFTADAALDVQVAEGRRVERALAAVPHARLSGVVVDDDKKPVSGARLSVLSGIEAVVTAPDGTFSIRWQAGEQPRMLEVEKPSYASATHGPLRLEPGEMRTGARIVLSRGTRFEIRLVDAQGVGIPDERVLIQRKADPDEPFRLIQIRCGGSSDTSGCRSDAEGKLTVNIVDGVYDIHVGGGTTVQKDLIAQKVSAAESPLIVELERGVTVEGRVVWSDGSPVTVPALVTADKPRGADALVTDGAFKLGGVREGKLMLIAQTRPPSLISSEPVEVHAPATGVVLKLARPGRIEGRVVERETKRAVTRFHVSAEARERMRRPVAQRTVTSDDGRFTLEDIPAGSIEVAVTAPGFVRSTIAAVEVAEAKATPLEIALERAGTVTGRVTAGGRPLAGAVVVAGDRPGARVGQVKQTDANGEYLLDTIPPGSQELMVRMKGYVSKTITVEVAVGEEVRGDVELSRGRELQGRVVDTAGNPVPSAEVLYGTGARPNFESRVTTDAEGAFKLQGLLDQPIVVFARKSGFAERTMEVNPAVTGSVTITLDRGASLSGRVTGLPPDELRGVEVMASTMRAPGGAPPRTPGGAPPRTVVNADGTFTLTGITDGEVVVSAQQMRPPGRRVSAEPVLVTGGSGPFVELDFAAGLTVHGRVTRQGQVVARGQVHLAPANPRPRAGGASGEIAPDGSYEVRVPAAGEYRVLVSLREASIGTNEMGRLDVSGDTRHDIDVRGAALRARVVDGSTGAAVPDAEVVLIAEGRAGTSRRSDSAGRVIFDFVGEGKYSLRVVKAGYASAPREAMVQNGVDAEVELAVVRGEPVVVRVVDAATGHGAQAGVLILDAAGGVAADRAAAQEPGGGSRYYLRPGNYTIRAAGREYQPKTVPLTVPGTPVVTIELVKR